MSLAHGLKQWTVYTYGAPVLVWAFGEADAMRQVPGARAAEYCQPRWRQ